VTPIARPVAAVDIVACRAEPFCGRRDAPGVRRDDLRASLTTPHVLGAGEYPGIQGCFDALDVIRAERRSDTVRATGCDAAAHGVICNRSCLHRPASGTALHVLAVCTARRSHDVGRSREVVARWQGQDFSIPCIDFLTNRGTLDHIDAALGQYMDQIDRQYGAGSWVAASGRRSTRPARHDRGDSRAAAARPAGKK
jgi:hypothetical protein